MRGVGSVRHPAARARVWSAARTKGASERFVVKRKESAASSVGHPAFSIARAIYMPARVGSDSGKVDASSGPDAPTGSGEPTGGSWTAGEL